MELGELVRASGLEAEISGEEAVEVTSLAYDSRVVQPGTLFFCVPGERSDGHDFAGAAVEAGAVGLVCERPLGQGACEVVVPDARAAMAPVAARFHGDPTSQLRVVGVTGTNGKTTTAFLVRHLLESAGESCGMLGTVERVVGGKRHEVERTTPEAIDLQASFAEMVAAGDRACVMEVSSHALVLRRVDSIDFAAKAFTNLSQDHLDFHGDMESYFEAKRLLFAVEGGAPELAIEGGISVVNVDDPYGLRLAGDIGEGPALVTYSAEGADADLSARGVSYDSRGSGFVLLGPRGVEYEVRTPLPGHFNVENALCSLAVARALDLDLEAAARALSDAPQVPGRFESIDAGQAFAVIVDYAHTPDSVESVLAAARRLTEGRVICVLGCGGDRDREKRPLMGRGAVGASDLTVITSDNPRSEDPDAIIEEMLVGAREVASDAHEFTVEPDRRAAIRLALESATTNDTVVIAGKGHEQGQELAGGEKVPFDDREVARTEIAALGEGGE